MVTHVQNIVGILTHSFVQSIDFKVGHRRVNGAGFHRVANAIRVGDITVKHVPKLGYKAAYDRINDVMEVGFSPPADIAHCGLVVHESVHALDDIRFSKLRVYDAEVLAYLAQALVVYYARKAFCDAHPKKNPFVPHPPARVAWETSKHLRNKRGAAPTAKGLAALRTTIKTHPDYKKHAHQWYIGNGV